MELCRLKAMEIYKANLFVIVFISFFLEATGIAGKSKEHHSSNLLVTEPNPRIMLRAS